jgi:hypothetical protein
LAARWENDLDRWIKNGVIDAAAAARIRAFEQSHETALGFRWPVLLAVERLDTSSDNVSYAFNRGAYAT